MIDEVLGFNTGVWKCLFRTIRGSVYFDSG